MDEWTGPALDTPRRDQVWPLAGASLQVVVDGGTQARRAPEMGGSPRVGDQAVAHIPALSLPIVAVSWLPQFLPGGPCGPAVSRIEPLLPFPDHVFAEPSLPTRLSRCPIN